MCRLRRGTARGDSTDSPPASSLPDRSGIPEPPRARVAAHVRPTPPQRVRGAGRRVETYRYGGPPAVTYPPPGYPRPGAGDPRYYGAPDSVLRPPGEVDASRRQAIAGLPPEEQP